MYIMYVYKDKASNFNLKNLYIYIYNEVNLIFIQFKKNIINYII